MKNKFLHGKWLVLWIVLFIVAVLAILVIAALNQGRAQTFNENPTFWDDDIVKIETRYKGDYPQDVVVFIGSSSIRKWGTLAEDMKPFTALNHGFGGSKIKDSTYYLNRLVFPFDPRAVVLFAGTNDLNGVEGSSKNAEQVYDGFIDFVEAVRIKDAELPIYYISISPTNARWKVWDEAHKANELIAEYTATQDNVTFIDTTEQLLGADGQPNNDLFVWDGLHLNGDGYAVWTSIIKPILEADLQP